MQGGSLCTSGGGRITRHRAQTREPLQLDHDEEINVATSEHQIRATQHRQSHRNHPNIDASIQLATVTSPQRGLRSRGYAPSST
jgi:hypothetical protein